jgi:hypothetical protein
LEGAVIDLPVCLFNILAAGEGEAKADLGTGQKMAGLVGSAILNVIFIRE